MTQYRPNIQDLVRTVGEFIAAARPPLKGERKYHALVASYLLGICRRELDLGPGFDRTEMDALTKFLKATGSLGLLRAQLCRGIRSGTFDRQADAVLRMLMDESVNNVRVVRPDHLAPMHRPPG